MQIARVVGDLTATRKHPTHEGKKILLVQPLDLDGSDRGNPMVALDSVQAGIGDKVLLVQDGYAAFTAVGYKQAPIDAAVIGVIDEIEVLPGLGPKAVAPDGGETPTAAKKQHKKNRS